MALTKAELRTLTKQMVGNRASATLTDAWYDTRVFDAYRRLATFQGQVPGPGARQPTYRRLRFFELQARTSRTLTTALTTNFVTPSDTNACVVVNVYNATDNVPLQLESLAGMQNFDPDGTGKPRFWCPAGQGGTVGYYIDKRPGSSSDEISVYEYTYNYPGAFAGDSSTPVIPDAWHMGIVYAAAADAARLIDIPEKADELEAKFMQFISERKSPVEEAGYARGGSRRSTVIGTRIY